MIGNDKNNILRDYGYTPYFKMQDQNNELIPARVTAVHREQYKIICSYGEANAKLKKRLL